MVAVLYLVPVQNSATVNTADLDAGVSSYGEE